MISLLTGDNHYAAAQQVRQLVAAADEGTEVIRLNGDDLSADDLTQQLSGISLFSSRRLVIIKSLAGNKPAWERLDDLLDAVDDDLHLVLVEPTADKRTRSYKHLQKLAKITDFSQPNEAQLVSWLQASAREQGTNIEPEAARFMVHYVGADQARLSSELDKLVLVASSITRADIEQYCEPTPQASAFEVVEAGLGGQRDKLSQELAVLMRSEDPYRFFGLLSSQVGVLAACSAAGQRSQQQIASDCKIHPFVVQKSLPVARRLGAAQVKRIIRLVADCDRQMKTSPEEPWRLIELAMMRMADR